MGGKDTYEALKKINPDVKILLSSGYSISGEAMELINRGCNGYIQKPFSYTQLSQRMREILDKK
jgi:DNA-binding NarL/FixJ family response regulator